MFFYAFTSFAQTLHFRHLTVSQGLSNNRAWSIDQDSKGFYWISTTDGLNRFDGKNITSYSHLPEDSTTICSNVINNVCENGNGELIIGTAEGVAVYDAQRDRFRTVFKVPAAVPFDDQSYIAQVLADRRGHLWVTTRRLLFELDDQYRLLRRFDKHDFGMDDVFRMLEDREGNIWIDVSGYLHKILVHENNRILNRTNATQWFFTHPIADYAFDTSGRLFIADNIGSSLRTFGSDGAQQSELRLFNGNPVKFLRLFVTANGTAWLVTTERGIIRVDPDRASIRNYMHAPGDDRSLCSNVVSHIAEDSYGNTWFCTDQGVDYLPFASLQLTTYRDFGFIDINHQLPIEVTSMLRDTNAYWIGTWGKGLCRIDRHSGKKDFFLPGKTDNDNYINDLAFVHGEIWIGNYSGLIRFDPLTRRFRDFSKHHPSELLKLPVYQFTKDRDNDVWISLIDGNGVLRYDSSGGEFIHYTNRDTGQHYFPYRHFAGWTQNSTGDIFTGYNRSKGIARYDVAHDRFEVMMKGDQLAFDNQVNCLLADGPYLWIGSNDGVTRLRTSDGSRIYYTRREGLFGNNVNTLAMDGSGSVWAGTNLGLSRIDPSSGAISRFSIEDGLPESGVNSLNFDPVTGLIHGISTTSVFNFDPNSISFVDPFSKPIIMQVKIMGQERSTYADGVFRLNDGEKVISIAFACPINPAVEGVHYAYRLQGFDRNWIDAGNSQNVTYTNLPAGKYTFNVRASLDKTHWQELQAPLQLLVDPPFYKRAWFMIVCVMLLMGLSMVVIYIRYRIKLQRVLLAQQIRNRIAADLHDDVASSLSSISIMSEVARYRMSKSPQDSENFLRQIGDNSRSLIEEISDIVWSVNPSKDDFGSLVERMRDFAATMFQQQEIEFEFETPEEIDAVKLSMEDRKNLYLIFKEIINNIVKHAACTKVIIRIAKLARGYELAVRDNGKGFDAKVDSTGNGLFNLRKRAEEMNAKFFLESVPGAGTTVRIEF